MQIQFLTNKLFPQQYLNFTGVQSSPRVNLQSKPDVFVRSSNVSFTSSSNVDDKMTVKDKLVAAGFVGVPMLIGIGVASALGGNQDSEDIFLPDGTFFMKASDLAGDKIHANAQTGELSIEGTPININPDKLDYVDAEKGIYKSADGNIDIDLLNNKYIDKEHGVFIDPERNISAMEINGELKNVTVPSFGSGHPLNDLHGASDGVVRTPEITKSEFIERYGMTPAEYMKENQGIPVNVRPDDDRSLAEKIKDYVSGKENEEMHDVFGRRIMMIQDSNGHVERVPISDRMEELLKEHNLDGRTLAKVADFFNDVELQRYISDEAPEYASMVHVDSMDEFIERLTSSSKDYDDVSVHHNHEVPDEVETEDVETAGENEIADWLSEIFAHLADEV